MDGSFARVFKGVEARRGDHGRITFALAVHRFSRSGESHRSIGTKRGRDAIIQRVRTIQVRAGRHARDRGPDAVAPRGIQAVRADHLPVHGTILARGPFTEELDLKVKARIGGELALAQVDDAADTIVQQITVQPGGFTGWHSHPGPAFVTVAQGTFTYYKGDDESCTGIPCGPGESFVDPGQGHVHSARNEGTSVVSLYVVYFDVPTGATSPFIPAANHGNCPF